MTAMQAFLSRPAPLVAPDLLGWRLAIGDLEARITETEAYHQITDLACHASRGRTPRTEALFARPGTLYVYRCYGIHWLLNLVCDQVEVPSAVLIRAVAVAGVAPRLSNGPGKVTRLLGLGQRHHGTHLSDGELRLLPPDAAPPRRHCGPRIGVEYADAPWALKRWRWWEAGFPVVRHHG